MHKKLIIIGAGPAGIGLSIVLKKMRLGFTLFEKDTVGSTFDQWPEGTQFLSPSFAGNFFKAPDLNAVCPDTAPSVLLRTEHPTGAEYAQYLRAVVRHYKLPVEEGIVVYSIEKKDAVFGLKTNQGDFTADFVVWAGGEFSFPKPGGIPGAELTTHSSQLPALDSFDASQVVPIVGGYESGYDTAINLAKVGVRSVIFDRHHHLTETRSDSSFALSPYTLSRLKKHQTLITIKPYVSIAQIEHKAPYYFLQTESGETFQFEVPPILANGFSAKHSLIKDLFEWEGNTPKITSDDESTITPNLFLVGPQVKHVNVVFCFIYKFRQRFAIVAETIAQRLGQEDDRFVAQTVAEYEDRNFYLKDLTCCEHECVC